MALDPNATTKDYTLILYNKTEIDEINLIETTRVNNALALKSLKADEGSPNGLATLDSFGYLYNTQLPTATFAEALTETENTKVITPKSLDYVLTARTLDKAIIGQPLGVPPLGITGLIPDSYLPAQQNVQTFVVSTLLELYALDTARIGDRGVVTNEVNPANNGEYVANIDFPSDATGWDLLPNLSSVQSVNTLTGDVTITSIAESAANAGRLDAVELDINSQGIRLDTAEATIISNTASSDANTAAILLKADQASLTITDGLVSANTAAIATKASQADLTITDTAVALNTAYVAKQSYNHSTIVNHVVTNDAYEQVNRLTTPSLDAGEYEIKLSMLYSLNSTTTSAYFRFSLDGGVAWTEVRKENKDTSDKVPETLIFTESYAGGIKDIIIQARKENPANILTVHTQTIVFERKA